MTKKKRWVRACEQCGRVIPEDRWSRRGPPTRFCGQACRKAKRRFEAWRRRPEVDALLSNTEDKGTL